MVAVSEQAWSSRRAPVVEYTTVQTRDGGRLVSRMALKFFAASLVIAAVTLVIVPADTGDATGGLAQIVVSLGLTFLGLTLWVAGAPVKRPELELDMVRREVRLVRINRRKRTIIVRRTFEQLDGAEIDGTNVRLWQDRHRLLAEVALTDPHVLARLRTGLRAAGHAV